MTQTDPEVEGHDDPRHRDTPAVRRPLLGVVAGFLVGAAVALALLGLLAQLGLRGTWVPYVPVVLGVVFLVAVSVWRGRDARVR